MTTRLPQVGERWLMRPRPSPEWACPECGKELFGDAPRAIEVVIIGPAWGTILRYRGRQNDKCLHELLMPSGMITARVAELPDEYAGAVPISWLEPLEAEGPTLRGEDPR